MVHDTRWRAVSATPGTLLLAVGGLPVGKGVIWSCGELPKECQVICQHASPAPFGSQGCSFRSIVKLLCWASGRLCPVCSESLEHCFCCCPSFQPTQVGALLLYRTDPAAIGSHWKSETSGIYLPRVSRRSTLSAGCIMGQLVSHMASSQWSFLQCSASLACNRSHADLSLN